MKTLTLNLKKQVLIVEAPMDAHDISIGTHCIGVKTSEDLPKDSNGYHHIYSDGLFFGKIDTELKLFCQGTPTEEQAAKLVEKITTELWKNYENVPYYFEYMKKNAVESFLSAVSEQNYHWLVNPFQEDIEGSFLEKLHDYKKWQKAEPLTLKNPLIFVKL